MTKQTIAIVIYANADHYPPTINAVHLLAKYYDVILICRNQDPFTWDYPDNVSLYRLGRYCSVREKEQQRLWSKLQEYINFIWQCRQILANVSLIYAYDAFGYVAACLSTHKIPLIYQNHDLNIERLPLSSLSGWVQKAEQAWSNRAQILVFPSLERAQYFQNLTKYSGLIKIVPNYPRISFLQRNENFDNLIAKRFSHKEILLQGAISRQNSLGELLESLNYLDDSISLKLIGPLKQKENFSPNKRVKYFNSVPYKELTSHTQQASIGVCLYKKIGLNYETMATASNKIYEYAACGLPVIVSDMPNYRKYLEQESWISFVDPDNPNSIAMAVKNIFSDLEQYHSMSWAARRAFEEKYNYESVFSDVLPQLEKLLIGR
jgi:glycosyltransferase involved in cell wall biosynthesis